MQTHWSMARGHLKNIRLAVKNKNHNFFFEETIRLMRWHLRSGGISLRRVGTSKTELERLKRAYYKNQATYWLHQCKLGESAMGAHVNSVRRMLRKAHAKIEDLGSSKEELLIIEENHERKFIKDSLYFLRFAKFSRFDKKKVAAHTKQMILTSLKRMGWTLEDMEVTKAELNRLCSY